MKKLITIMLFTLFTLFSSFESFSQDESGFETVMVIASKKHSDFYIGRVTPENEETHNRYRFKDNSYNVMLKKELDKWMNKGFKIVDSSTAFGVGEGIKTHQVIYILERANNSEIHRKEMEEYDIQE